LFIALFCCCVSGVTGDSAEITGDALTVQPAILTAKGLDHVSAETTFDTGDLDMNMFEDFTDDPLGDASLDSFMDINALLAEVRHFLIG
jgi:hypothetical protein